ncbi:MAG: hypothetical protein HYU64_06865 [Armatimonadetes bacterium]|nr:hypothetical protein [Armatimonadota bacterium]
MDFDALVKQITEEVLRELERRGKAPPGEAGPVPLILLEGNSISRDFFSSLQVLESQGKRFQVVMPARGKCGGCCHAQPFDPDNSLIKIHDDSALAAWNKISSVERITGDLLDKASVIVLPHLSLASLARLASLFCDNGFLRGILEAIQQEKRILAATDDFERFLKGPYPSFSELVRGYSEKIGSFGIALFSRSDLVRELSGPSSVPHSTSPLSGKAGDGRGEVGGGPAGLRFILTRDDILEKKKEGAGRITVPPDGIVTSLAEETARDVGVDLVRE